MAYDECSKAKGEWDAEPEDQTDCLRARVGGTPAPRFSCDQRSLHGMFLFFRCDLDHGDTVEVQPAFVESRSIFGKRGG